MLLEDKGGKETGIISVKKLLDTKLNIPPYQRPYKWTEKHVTQLIDDICRHKYKSAYRIGTVVLHKNEGDKYDIVDGQQRFITFLLIVHALCESHNPTQGYRELKSIKNNIDEYKYDFSSDITQTNIRKNYEAILAYITRLDSESIQFLFEKCEVVRVVIDDLSEAFQFFDSQNARGKALEPHDLLKAFHLREMHAETAEEKERVVETWEAAPLQELSDLFSIYLYRLRRWIHGKNADGFNKDKIDEFKGLSAQNAEYPCARAVRIVDLYVSDYNKSMHSAVHQRMPYPFQLDQPVINGKRFFEMIAHYFDLFSKIRDTHDLRDEIEHYERLRQQMQRGLADENLTTKKEHSIIESWHLDDSAIKILHELATYRGKYRDGDKYTRVLFDCCLAYYIDKFDTANISHVIKDIFVWAYSIRLDKGMVQYRRADNHATGTALFKKLRELTDPRDFIAHATLPKDTIDKIKNDDASAKYLEKIQQLFRDIVNPQHATE